MKTSKALAMVLVLQVMILAGQWLGTPQVIGTAGAQQIDPARDRAATLDELRSVNAKLDRLIDLLGSGNLQVKVIAPDENKGRSSAR